MEKEIKLKIEGQKKKIDTDLTVLLEHETQLKPNTVYTGWLRKRSQSK